MKSPRAACSFWIVIRRPGSVGFAWRDVIIAKRGNIVEWSIDGVKLAAFTSASVTASNVFVGYWDPLRPSPTMPR